MPEAIASSAGRLARFSRMLARGSTVARAGVESTGTCEATGGDLSRSGLVARLEASRETLHRIVEQYLHNEPELHEIVKQLVVQGDEALQKLEAGGVEAVEQDPQVFEGLEAIVRTDGSRPSFLVRNGEVDLASSPVGTWEAKLTVSADQLRNALDCVGRIDVPGNVVGFVGTGFLIQENLILTNRHVLQLAARRQPDGSWRFAEGAAIDFGHELQGRASVNRRLLKRVVFCGAREIDFYSIDHKKLDLALIELHAGAAGTTPSKVFALELSAPWRQQNNVEIFTIGYPGSPSASLYPPTLLEQLFRSTYGHKRLAPGAIIAAQTGVHNWTLAHDATTLGGNSGSILLMIGQEGLAAGLHYGGRSGAPSENWGHVLADVLGETDGLTALSLGEVLKAQGVRLLGTRPSMNGEAPQRLTPGLSSPTPEAVRSDREAPPRDWRRGITLATMQRLSAQPGVKRLEAATLEAAGDGHTAPAELASRTGYDSDFLPGWVIRLPAPSGDMRALRRGGSGVELKYQHFSVIMSASRRMPLLTACNINGAESRRLPRITRWSYDGRLDEQDQWGNELYLHNDVDRGHMVRREDPVWGSLSVARTANSDTFHYTNSCPQMAGVNQVIWLGLENYILDHTREDNMRVSVFTGPIFTANDLPYRGALIPRAFWKIVAFLTADGRPSATAYRVSQARELEELEFVFAGYSTFQISVQQVADATGIDFGALVPFDGFSQHERVHGVTLTERLESLDQIRV